MIPTVASSPAPGARSSDAAERLRDAARELESVFVEQMFKAMRATVPDDGLMSGGSGEEMFTSMMDQHLASQQPGRVPSELAEAVYRQLRGAAGIPESPAVKADRRVTDAVSSLRAVTTPPVGPT